MDQDRRGLQDLPLELGVHLFSFLTLDELQTLTRVSCTIRRWVWSMKKIRVSDERVVQWDFLRSWPRDPFLPEIDGWISVPEPCLLQLLSSVLPETLRA